MTQETTVYFTITLLFLIMSLVFVLFFVFHNKKMLQHKAKLAEIELARSKQNLIDTIEIQEKEMARLGMDLHDELGPTLSAVKLKINALGQTGIMKKEDLTQLRDMMDHTISNVRNLSHTLYPNTLSEFGLSDAIHELVKRIDSVSSIEFEVRIAKDTDALDFTTQLSLYRITQEFINNSIKHSGCSKLTIQVTVDQQGFLLLLADNGKGYLLDAKSNGGLGLKNMRMRSESIHAVFAVESAPGAGMTVQVGRTNKS